MSFIKHCLLSIGVVLSCATACSAGGAGSSETRTSTTQVSKQALTECVADSDCESEDYYCGIDGECHNQREEPGCGLYPGEPDIHGYPSGCQIPCRVGHDEGEYCVVGSHCTIYGGDLVCKIDLPCTTNSDCDTANYEYCDTGTYTCHG